MKAPQQSLKNWGDQKWRTKSGKKSSDTGERYLTEAALTDRARTRWAVLHDMMKALGIDPTAIAVKNMMNYLYDC